MLFSGKIKKVDGCPHKSSVRLIRAFETLKCQVSKKDNDIIVEMPSWDAGFFLTSGALDASFGDYSRPFSDKMILSVQGDGEVHYRIDYWSWTQVILHCAITAMFSLHYLLGNSHWNVGQFMLLTVFGNFLPLLICLNSVYLKREKAFSLAKA
jgi:hypothetical protein